MGSFAGIYDSQVWTGRHWWNGTTMPSGYFTSAIPGKAAALVSKHLLQEEGGGTEDICLCSSGCPESAPAKLLTSPALQSQSAHAASFSTERDILSLMSFLGSFSSTAVSGQVSIPACWEHMADT